MLLLKSKKKKKNNVKSLGKQFRHLKLELRGIRRVFRRSRLRRGIPLRRLGLSLKNMLLETFRIRRFRQRVGFGLNIRSYNSSPYRITYSPLNKLLFSDFKSGFIQTGRTSFTNRYFVLKNLERSFPLVQNKKIYVRSSEKKVFKIAELGKGKIKKRKKKYSYPWPHFRPLKKIL